jgi:hypothetical protein
MALRKTLFIICLVISALFLAGGFWISGQWLGAMVAILTGPAWLFARKYPASWLLFICLLGTVCLAVVGTLTGAPGWLMISGSGFALAARDLLLLNDSMGKHSAGEPTRLYELSHLRSLALALGSGLLAALLGRLVNLQLPFIVMALFIALAFFGMDRVWGYINKRN